MDINKATVTTPLEHLETVKMQLGEKRLTEEQKKKIVRDVLELQASERISNEVAGRICGCSGSAWSLIRRGLYQGDAEKYLRAAHQWLADRVERVEAPVSDYVKTAIGERILKVCHRAWRMPCIGLIVAPSGIGKTKALKEFCRRRGQRAAYIQAGEGCCNKLSLMMEICRRVGVYPRVRRTVDWYYQAVRERLADFYAQGRADPYCLVIDEATTLRPSGLNMLRNLHDDDLCRPAIVLADTWRLDVELHSRHGLPGGYEQLRSRSGAQYLMRTDADILMSDVKAVGSAVLASLGRQGNLHNDAWKFLHAIAQADGKLRNVVHRIHAVNDVADSVGSPPLFSPAELDYVASIVGAQQQLRHASAPFGEPQRTQPYGPQGSTQKKTA